MRGNLSTFSNASFAALAAVYILFTIVTLCIFNMVYEVQSLPFLDEIFHVPQAEKYCRGLFTEVSIFIFNVTMLPDIKLL
jgi:hypothetical protein